MDDLNQPVLEAFRDRRAALGRNSTLGEHFIRLKAVLKHFAEHVDPTLDLAYLKKVSAGSAVFDKRVIYLNAQELDALDRLVLPDERDAYVRDFFLLSCYTGLRHVDLHFSENKIMENKNIQIFAQKTSTTFSVPYLARARAIMARLKASPYREKYKKQLVGNYSAQVKRICKQVPSFLEKEAVTVREDSPEKARWELISSKVRRKTFINICMLAGVASDVVAQWVGHTTVEMIHRHYKDHAALGEQARVKLNEAFQAV